MKLDVLEFLYRFAFGISSLTTYVWTVVTALLIIYMAGVFGGRIWNKSWKLTGHGGALSLVVFFAILGALSIFTWRSATRFESWLTEQHNLIPNSVAKSNRFQRAVLIETWAQLAANGSQTDLTPPDQSGNEVRLNHPEDANVLAAVAAEQARTALRLQPPFLFGAPLAQRPPAEVAVETLDTLQVPPTSYPRVVTSDNEWTITAATLQTDYALTQCAKQYVPELNSLKTGSLVLLALSFLIPLIMCSMRALDDIKIHPKA